jgi:hypothetical protein
MAMYLSGTQSVFFWPVWAHIKIESSSDKEMESTSAIISTTTWAITDGNDSGSYATPVASLGSTTGRALNLESPTHAPKTPLSRREHQWGSGPRGRRALIARYIQTSDVVFQRKYCVWEPCFSCKRTGTFEIRGVISCKLYCCAECKELLSPGASSGARLQHSAAG